MQKNKKNRVELEAGDLIEHTTQDFGQGRVMEVKDGVATIAFKKSGKKRFPAGSRYLVLAESAESDNETSNSTENQTPQK